jgi:hypothetical protein
MLAIRNLVPCYGTHDVMHKQFIQNGGQSTEYSTSMSGWVPFGSVPEANPHGARRPHSRSKLIQ